MLKRGYIVVNILSSKCKHKANHWINTDIVYHSQAKKHWTMITKTDADTTVYHLAHCKSTATKKTKPKTV